MAKKKMSMGQVLILSLVSLVAGAACGVAVNYITSPLPDSYEIPAREVVSIKDPSITSTEFSVETIKEKDFSIHFMELGNKYTGDSTLIKSGDIEVLIDAGSKVSSVETIYNYAKEYVVGKLDYIIVTHAHEDHYAGFSTTYYNQSLFSKFDVGEGTTIIDFAQITKNKASNTMYKNYQSNLQEAVTKGAVHKTVDKLVGEVISLGSNASMKMLDQKYYHQVAATENDHSVCTLFTCGTLNYLFTGDLEKGGEESLVDLNPTLPHVEVYKAGHHGSKTSSSTKLMEKIQPKKVCVCCCSGSSEYTKTDNNQFPTQEFVDRVGIYTDQIYVTSHCVDYDKGIYESMNGNIIITQDKDDTSSTTYCSNNTTILKETDWFKAHRTWPSK